MDDRDSGVRRSRRWISIYLFGAVAAFLTFPNPAAASTLGSSGSAITYSAIAGEVNKLTVTQVGSNIVIAETGGVIITPSVPCVSLLPGTASCPVAGIRNISLTLQNMDDSASYDDSIGPPVTGVTIDAGVDNDTMAGEGLVPGFFIAREGNDVVTGTDAADDIRADVGDDTVVSGLGNDYIDEGPGADTMIAGPGNDRFAYEQPANGADVLDGGPGISDSVDARARTSDLSISINGIADDGDAAEGDNLIGIERIDTGSGNDTITGGPGPDLILANDGNDVLSGGAGPDFLGGGDGNDTANGSDGGDNIAGGNGGDTMDGGGADDEFSGEMFDDGTDTYTGGSGVDTISGIGDFIGRAVTVDLDGVADDGVIVPQEGVPLDNAGTDIENLVLDVPGEGSEEAFAATNDILVGNDSANLIDGGPGDDRINGLGGPDALLGGAGGDQLDGGSGTDDLDGAGGADTLRSRDSNPDEVNCGSSADTLLADSLDDFTLTCDQSSTGARLKTKSAKVKKGKATLKVICPEAEGIDCKVTVTATKGRKTLAKGSGKVKSGKTGSVKVKLTRAGKGGKAKKLTLKTKTVMTDKTGVKVATTTPELVLSR